MLWYVAMTITESGGKRVTDWRRLSPRKPDAGPLSETSAERNRRILVIGCSRLGIVRACPDIRPEQRAANATTRWRLRFLVAPREQLWVDFHITPNQRRQQGQPPLPSHAFLTQIHQLFG
jgi:uncharacterized protein involved in type VI secretion and phage assembly